MIGNLAGRNEDLAGYLQTHANEIIDYGNRQAAVKPIGSCRMEKGVVHAITVRQKRRA